MALPNPSMSFSPFAILTAAEMNDLVENIEALAAGTGLNNNAVPASALATNAITLGYIQLTSNFSSGTTAETLVTGLNTAVTIPAGGRRVKTSIHSSSVSGATGIATIRIYDGVFGSGGVQIAQANIQQGNGFIYTFAVKTPSAGSKTYTATIASTSGNPVLGGSATAPIMMLVELI